MKKMMICLTCLVALMAATIAISSAQGDKNTVTNTTLATNTSLNSINMTNNVTGQALRAGFETTKPVTNLDRFGNKSAYDIEAYSQNKLLFNSSNATPVQPIFNVSQRSGNTPTIIYNTEQPKPMVSVNTSPPLQVYNIVDYSPMKMGTPIP